MLEKTISRTEMIDTHSKGSIMECVIGYIKILCAGSAVHGARSFEIADL